MRTTGQHAPSGLHHTARRIALSLLVAAMWVVSSHSPAMAVPPTLADYTAYPPFVSTTVEPNVLILLDNSGSMNSQAYDDDDDYSNIDSSYDSSRVYYGYFDASARYTYQSSRFEVDATGLWSGNFLNWATMRRIDIAKKVLVGGTAIPRTGAGNVHSLVGQNVFSPSALCCNTFIKRFNGTGETPYSGDYYYGAQNGYLYVDDDSGPFSGYIERFQIRVRVETEPTGVIQQVMGKVRLGLELYNSSEGGHIDNYIASNNTPMINSIQNVVPSQWTPLAEAFYEGIRYFQQLSPNYANSDYTVNQQFDPYYYQDLKQYVRCCNSSILLISDGESTQDLNIPSGLQDFDGDGNDPGSFQYSGSDYLDDVALWAHTTDLRSPSFGNDASGQLSGTQSVSLYSIFAFGAGSQLLSDAAKNGGFKDQNGNNRPDLQSEWDGDNDGIPDNYFAAPDGAQLESAILRALSNILQQAASGTSLSVLSNSTKGNGMAYQAYFYPSQFDGVNEVRWTGFLQAFFTDKFGNLREDTDGNGGLSLADDRIMELSLNSATGTVEANLYSDPDQDGVPDTLETTVPVNAAGSLWEGGEKLALTSSSARTIYTWVDGNNDGLVGSGEFIDFASSNASTLAPYLRASDSTEAGNVINYIRGDDIPGYRSRLLTVNNTLQTWKLGDIVYSTPTVVGPPKEQYDLIYGDASYLSFAQQYRNRRQVIYIGANDGMLHAFEGGIVHAGDNPATSSVTEEQWIEAVSGHPLGEELWGFVPYQLLPHLKWLTQSDYTHVYYVDLKPKVTDVRIFADDSTHPGGWGTILIGGMRFGGGPITVTDDFGSGTSETRTFRSAYFILDITDPDQAPTLLWSFSTATLGFSASYPAVLRFEDSSNQDHWYVAVGSGPTDYDGNSSQNGQLFILELGSNVSGIPTSGLTVQSFTSSSDAWLSDVITVDANLDYDTDVAYVGETLTGGSALSGKLLRLTTNNTETPSSWTLSTLLTTDSGQAVTSGASASKDPFNKLWVFFGTGKFMSTVDKTDFASQSLYGVKDPCWKGTTSGCPTEIVQTDLVDVSTAVVSTDQSVTGVTISSGTVDTVTELLTAVAAVSGWLADLPLAGERVISKGRVLGGLVLYSTYLPDSSGDVCSVQGQSWLYALSYLTGASSLSAPLGLNGTTILASTSLGSGASSSVGLHIGVEEGATGFVQQSSGAITKIDMPDLPLSIKSGITAFRERL